MKRPMSLNIIATLWVAFGMWTIVAEAYKGGGLVLPGNVFDWLNIFAGIGLLKLKRGWRTYALVMLGFAFVLVVPFSVWACCNPERITLRLPAVLIIDRPHEILKPGIVAAVCFSYTTVTVWMLWVLMRRDVRELFQPRPVTTI